MKSFDGYLKQKLGDSYIHLTNGGHKSLEDFLTRLFPNPTESATFNVAQQHGNMKLIGFINGNNNYTGQNGAVFTNRTTILHFAGGSGNSQYWNQLYFESGIIKFRSENHLDWYTVYHSGNLPAYPTKASWNYDDRYVFALGTNGNYLTWTKNNTTNNITVPYAGSTDAIKRVWQRGNDCKPTENFPQASLTRFYMYDGTTANKPSTHAGFMMVNGWDWGSGGTILAQDFGDGEGRLYTANKDAGDGKNWTNWKKVAFYDDITWANIASKPTATGNATTPVYWNGSGFTNCTAYANASVANSATLGGYAPSYFQTAVYSTGRNFVNGTLITTDIPYNKSNGDPFYMVIKGNVYRRLYSCYTQVQGYIYQDTIINYGVSHLGICPITGIIAMLIDTNLCFWFPRQSYWEGYSIEVYSAYNYRTNRVVSVTDSADPGGTKRVILNDHTISNINTDSVSPSLAINGNTIAVTVGGVTSSYIQVPYSGNADKLDGKDSTEFSLSGHKHPYTDLTGSTTTANQAIVSSGVANGWTLKTLGSNAFNSTAFIIKSDILDYLYQPQADLNLNSRYDYQKFYSTTWSFSYSTYVLSQPSGDRATTAATVLSVPGQYPFQIYRFYNSNDLYVRGYYSGSGWTNWSRIALTGEAPTAHTHPYTQLTGSGTTANQAILSNGTANGWKLATVSLDGHNHNTSYVTSVGVTNDATNHPNQLRYVLNGTSYYFTVPYATSSNDAQVLAFNQINTEENINQSGLRIYQGSGSSWTGNIISMAYAAILALGGPSRGWQLWSARGSDNSLIWRNGLQDASGWEDPRIILDSVNYSTYCATTSHNHNSSYVASLGTNGNYVTWTKNGTTNNITVPYATSAASLAFERVSDMHATTGWKFFTLVNSTPSNGPTANGWAQGVTFLPNNDGSGYRHIVTFWGNSKNNDLFIKNQWSNTWGDWRKILTSANYTDYAATKDHNHNSSYITLVGITDDNTNHPNQLRYVLNNSSTYFTVPYATNANTSNSSKVLTHYHAITGSSSNAQGKWIKFATISLVDRSWQPFDETWIFGGMENSGNSPNGILRLTGRRSGTNDVLSNFNMYWITLGNTWYSDKIVACKNGADTYDIYIANYSTNQTMTVYRISINESVTFVNGTWGELPSTPSYTSSVGGYVNVANTWANSITLTIGNTGKSINGRANVSWTLAEIGAAAEHSHPYLPLAGGTMTADALISWGNNDRTDWDSFGTGLRIQSSIAASTGAPTQYSSCLNVGTRYSFQIAAQGGDFKNFFIRNSNNKVWCKLLHDQNSSVSKSGETLTVKINDSTQTLTNTWRGIQNNLNSDSTTDSLSAAQGKALNNKFANYVPKVEGTGSVVAHQTSCNGWAGAKIVIPGGYKSWMMCFTIRIYSSYNYTDIVVGGYHYGSNHWYLPSARVIGGTQNFRVVMGYEGDTANSLYVWFGFTSSNLGHGGFSIMNVHAGYNSEIDWYQTWTISNVGYSSLTNKQYDADTVLPAMADHTHTDLLTALNWDSTNKKIQYKKQGATTWTDLADISGAWTDNNTWRKVLVAGAEKLGNANTTGDLKFVNGNYTTVTWNDTNKTIQYDCNLIRTATATSLTSLDVTKTFIYATISANVAASAFTLSAAMTVGQCLTVLVYNSGSTSITIAVPSAWKSLDGYTLSCGATKFIEISIVHYASGANDYIVSSKAQ